MKRRDALRGVGVAAGIVALAGCSSPGGGGADSPEHSGTEPAVGERTETQASPAIDETNTAKGQTETAGGNETSDPAGNQSSREPE